MIQLKKLQLAEFQRSALFLIRCETHPWTTLNKINELCIFVCILFYFNCFCLTGPFVCFDFKILDILFCFERERVKERKNMDRWGGKEDLEGSGEGKMLSKYNK